MSTLDDGEDMQRRSMYGQRLLRMEGEWGLHSTNGF